MPCEKLNILRGIGGIGMVIDMDLNPPGFILFIPIKDGDGIENWCENAYGFGGILDGWLLVCLGIW